MAMSVGGSGEGQSYSEINMTPLIDVMLVLLIIFIITLPNQTHAVKIDNPLPPPPNFVPPPPPEVVLPPPPKLEAPPPPFIPPPEIQIATPPPPAPTITAVTPTPPPAPVVIAPAPPVVAAAPAPPAPAGMSAGVVCSNYQTVMGDTAFPREAVRLGLERGEALVQFTLSATGEVKDVKVLRSSHAIFARNSVRVVGEYKCQGQGREVTVQVPFGYKLE